MCEHARRSLLVRFFFVLSLSLCVPPFLAPRSVHVPLWRSTSHSVDHTSVHLSMSFSHLSLHLTMLINLEV